MWSLGTELCGRLGSQHLFLLSSQPSGLYLPNAGIRGMCHYGQFFDYAKIGLLILVFNLVGDVLYSR